MDALVTYPLQQFPGLRTEDAGAFGAVATELFGVRSFDVPGRRPRDVRVVLNRRRLTDIDLFYARYGAPIAAGVDHADFFLQGIARRGSGDVRADRAAGIIARGQGVVAGPGARLVLNYAEDYEHFIIRIRPDGLVRKLAALVGTPIDPPLRLESHVGDGGSQLRLIEFLIGEIDRAGPTMPPLLLAEMEQAVLVAYLLNSRHNYSRLLGGGAQDVAPWQVRRVEEFMRANWDRPLSIESLADVTGTSARSLFHSFRKTRGISPMVFLRRVRLGEARRMLAAGAPGVSVTSVAFDCGFSNLGKFARQYRDSFGELPSETLRSSRTSGVSVPHEAPHGGVQR